MKSRNEVDAKYTWQTKHFYENDEAVEVEMKFVGEKVSQIPEFAGILDDFSNLEKVLKISSDCMKRVMKLESYANRNRDVDMTVAKWQELAGRVDSLSTSLAQASSYVEPELLGFEVAVLKDFQGRPQMSDFTRYFDALLKNKPHTLAKGEESIMARFGALALAEYETYSTFSSTDMKFPKIELNGELVEINMPTYARYRQSDDRDVRKKVFDAFWAAYDGNKNAIAKMLHYQIKYYTTTTGIRKYNDCLEAEMKSNELPNDFFYTLRDNISAILPAMHEYLELKKEVLNIPDQGYHDVYAKMVSGGANKTYDYEKSVELVNEALKPMTDEYKKVIGDAMKPENGWVDVYPNKGKASGAYMSGEAYDVHPYVMLNHIDDYNSVSTLAHEMGHAMHSYYSNGCQPFEKSQYTIFVAEVASTFNEIMLINHLLDITQDKEEKKFLLNHYIEMIRSTVFRQMQFAEFEDSIYKKVEEGSMLTPEFLTEAYGATLSKYYGEEKGLMTIDPLYKNEWAFVPHFYYNYYVYKYVVGFIGALSFAESVRRGEIPAESYINGFLKAGSSKPPLDILKDAGVDMTSEKPYKLIEKVFTEKLAELKSLI